MLLYLVENPLRTLSKNEILGAVWQDVATTEASLVRCISLLRKELVGRDGSEVIRTVRGRGYSMAVPVEVVADPTTEEAAPQRLARWPLVASAAALSFVALSWWSSLPAELATNIDESAAARFADPPRLPESLSAYEFYLRGPRAAREVEREEQRAAIAHYQLAVEIDPNFVAGYVALAEACREFWNTDETDEGAAGLLVAAESAAQRAIELAPDDHAALTALAQVELSTRDWEGSEATFQRAFAAGDSADARRDYANLLMMLGRLQEAGPQIERMIELEPLSARNQRAAGRLHLYRGKYAKAIPHLEKSLELDPTEPFAPRLMASAHHYLGNDRESRDAYLLLAPAWMRGPLRRWDQVRGPGAALRAALELDALRLGDRCREDPQGTALAWAHLEEAEAMYACLEKASARHLWYIQVEPVYGPYRSSPRFAEILARGGFPALVAAVR